MVDGRWKMEEKVRICCSCTAVVASSIRVPPFDVFRQVFGCSFLRCELLDDRIRKE
jgi:hypothetical protein